MPPGRHGQAGTGGTAWLLGYLQPDFVQNDGVVTTNGTGFLNAQDLLELGASRGDEGRRRIGGWACDAGLPDDPSGVLKFSIA